MQKMWVQSLGWEDPLEKEMATHSSVLAWKSQGQRSLAGCSAWGCKESNTTERLSMNAVAIQPETILFFQSMILRLLESKLPGVFL